LAAKVANRQFNKLLEDPGKSEIFVEVIDGDN
jgi:hypothetical protein